jgi:DNA repair exonuclease SbcCD ATPase subunit
MFSIIPDLDTIYPSNTNDLRKWYYNNNNDVDSEDEIIQNQLDQAIQLKECYKRKITELNKDIEELDKYIENFNKQLEEFKKKTNYFEEIQRIFKAKYGNEPYLNTFINLYDELSKNKNITIEIIKDKSKGYEMLIDAGGLDELEKMKVKLLKDMFIHINQMIFNQDF